MGNCAGGPQTAEEREAKARSELIDKGLKKDKDVIENTIKILLLGEDSVLCARCCVNDLLVLAGTGPNTRMHCTCVCAFM